MKDNDTDFHTGHRERLRQKFLEDKLTDPEKLELLLSCVIPRRDVRPLARRILNQFGTISGILTTPIERLVECDGLGRNTAIFFKLINQMLIDGYKYKISNQPIFYDRKLLENYCLHLLSEKTVEETHVLYLDSNMKLIQDDVHTRGTLGESAIYPREIIARAISLKAKHIVLVHNHPSGCATFSSADMQVTGVLARLLRDLDINLYDHLLVANNLLYSAKDLGAYIS